MPHNNHSSTAHAGASPGDDLGSTDEVKVFKDEGDKEDENISSENLLEEKSSLIDLTESEDKTDKNSTRQDHSPVYGKHDSHSHASSFNMGYLVSPYSYANGGAGALPVSMANKMGLTPFFCHNGDHLTTPPPAHCGIPAYQLDPKTMGLTRPAIYPFPATQYAYPMLSPEMTAASWHTPSMYSAASGFRSPYPSSLPINTTLPSDFYRFSPSLLPSVHPHHVLNSHPAIVTPGPKQEIIQESNHRYGRQTIEQKNSSSSIQADNSKDNAANDKKKPHIKKPLNAFMLYMKEMRAKVVAECTLKESAAINQILGRKWHALGREEQAKYYELARRERQLHMQMYPDWSSRTNSTRGKKRKRKQDTNDGGNSMKKCRARYGLDQQNQWCKPCRRKKKCIRYKEAEEQRDMENHVSDDNLGSCGSVDEAQTPDDDTESLNQSMSSPGGLSGLSSLQSPSTSLASPINLLASPSTPTSNQQQQLHHDVSTTTMMDINLTSINGHSSSTASSSSLAAAATSLVNSMNHRNKHQQSSASLPNQYQQFHYHNQVPSPRPMDSKLQNQSTKSHHKQQNGILTSDEIKKESQHKSINNSINHMATDVQIKIEPMDIQQQQHHQMLQQRLQAVEMNFYDKLPIIRNPVGANPRDINNPLSVNQLTKRDFSPHSTAAYLALNHAIVSTAANIVPSQSNADYTQRHHSLFQKHHHHQQMMNQHSHHHQHHHHHLQHHLHHNLHNLHAANMPTPLHFQLAAAAAAQQQSNGGSAVNVKQNGAAVVTSSANHRPAVDDGNAISVT